MFTLQDAVRERLQMEAKIEYRAQKAQERAVVAFGKTKAGRQIAECRSLRWCPPAYKGGAAEWKINNAEGC